MISDVLFQAIEDIRDYLANPVYTRAYESVRAELGELLTHIDRVRQMLDAPVQLGEFIPRPNGGQHGPTT